MTVYRLFGVESSPFSQKVKAALVYKRLDFEWISRSHLNDAAFAALATAPSVPLLVYPDGSVQQHSAAILARLEADHPAQPLLPAEPACAALSLMLQDFGDTWLNKCMVQERWGKMPDRLQAAQRVLAQRTGGLLPAAWKAPAQKIAEKMLAQLSLVGAEAENQSTLEASCRRFAIRLNAHLKEHLYIFGGRPSAADLAIATQFGQMLCDPTPGTWLTERAPFVVAWCETMKSPVAAGPFEPLASLELTLKPLFESEISKTYLPWASANLASAKRTRQRFSVTLSDGLFEQATQPASARAFSDLQRMLQEWRNDPELLQFLAKTESNIVLELRAA